MFSKLPRPLALAWLTFCSLMLGASASLHAATTAYTDGDLFLGFRATGGTGATKDYLVNIGPASALTSASSATTLNTGNIATDLAATFGANWATRTDLVYSLIGGTAFGTTDDPENTLYSSNPIAAPWDRRSDGAQSSTTSRTASLGDFYSSNTSTANNNAGLVQTVTDTNSYASYQPGGTFANSQGISFGAFNPTNEGVITSTLYINRLTPSSQVAGKVLLGTLAINASGVATFTPDTAPAAPSVRFTSATFSVSEAGTNAAIGLTRDGDATTAFTVKLSTADGGGVAGTDYTAQNSVTVNFAANATTATANIPVADRPGFQGSRTFVVSLATPSNGVTLGTPSTATVTITDDDPQPAGALAFATATVQSNALNSSGSPATLLIPVTRTGGSGGAVSATVSAVSNNLSGADFTAPATISFAAGATTGNVSIVLGTIDPTKLPATITLTLSAPTGGATLGAQTSTVITLKSAGRLAFSVAAADTTEGAVDSTLTVTVNRTGGSNGAVSVDIGTSGTATINADYTLPSQTVTLNWTDGDSAAKSFLVTIKADGATEPLETIVLALQNVQGGAVIGTPASETISIGAPDAVIPTLTVVKPKANSKVSGANVTVTGVAKDNLGVGRVELKLNGTLVDTQTPGAATATFSYSSTIVPEQGLNSLEVTAFDGGGNASSTVLRKFTFINVRPALAGKYNGLLVADAGAAQLDYNGLVAITVTSGGSFTGKVSLSGTVLPIKGLFLNSGVAGFGAIKLPGFDLVKKVAGVTTPLGTIALTLDTGAGHKITGTLKQTGGNGTLATIPSADQALYSAAKTPLAPFVKIPATIYNPTGEKGKYTALFLADAAPNNTVTADKFPQGDGFGRITVSTAGKVTIKGKLADGSIISYSNALSLDNKWPVFIPLYGKKGFITASVAFDPTQSQTDASAPNMRWFKPAALTRQTTYPDGWPNGITVDFVASKFLAKTVTALGATPAAATDPTVANIRVDIADGGTGTGFANTASITSTSKVKALAAVAGETGATNLKVTLTASTGLLTGSFTHPSSNKAVTLNGVVYQKTSSAAGYFLYKATGETTSISGGVSISALP